MDNTDLQKNIEIMGKERRDNIGHEYFGDKCAKTLYRILKKYIRGSILDCGAGTGAFIKELKRRGYGDVRGVDLYPKVDFVEKGDITNLKYENESFGTIIFTEVMEHLNDEQINNTLNGVQRILKKKGHLIISIPYKEKLLENTIQCPYCSKKFHRYGHLRNYSLDIALKSFERENIKCVFSKVYAIGAMAKLPMGRYLNWLFKKLKYKSISQTLVLVLEKF